MFIHIYNLTEEFIEKYMDNSMKSMYSMKSQKSIKFKRLDIICFKSVISLWPKSSLNNSMKSINSMKSK